MCTHSLCNTVTHCKHNATNCNTQHTATHFSTRLCSRSLVAVILRVHTLFVSHGKHCNILQHSATCCNNLQQTVTHCNIIEISWSLMAAVLRILLLCVTRQHAATRCNTLQHTAAHCNILQRTATHSNKLHQHHSGHPAPCHTLDYAANTLQHTATHCNALQRAATHCNALQHTATHCNTLQHANTNLRVLCAQQIVLPCLGPPLVGPAIGGSQRRTFIPINLCRNLRADNLMHNVAHSSSYIFTYTGICIFI